MIKNITLFGLLFSAALYAAPTFSVTPNGTV